MSPLRSIVLTLVLSTLAAAIGAWGGAHYVLGLHRPTPLHETLHHELHLSGAQQQRLDGLERHYAETRRALEAEMRAANGDLARAYQQGHAYTPAARAAIDRFHRASDTLQKETLLHVIAMRQILTADQTGRFDDSVVKSLTDQAP